MVPQVYFYAGDIVELWGGTQYYVTKVNPKNAKLIRLDNGKHYVANRGSIVKVVHRSLTKDESDRCFPKPSATLYLGTVGTLVKKINNKKYYHDPDQRWVVIGFSQGDEIRIAKLYGDGNRYWRVPSHYLQPVDTEA